MSSAVKDAIKGGDFGDILLGALIGGIAGGVGAGVANLAAGIYKCNKFVCDVLTEADASPGLPNGNPIKKLFGYGSPPTAEQWADSNYDIPSWDVVSTPQAGDVVAVRANYSSATGHVAIMISGTQSIGANQFTVKISNFGTSSYDLSGYPGNNGYVYRRYVGN